MLGGVMGVFYLLFWKLLGSSQSVSEKVEVGEVWGSFCFSFGRFLGINNLEKYRNKYLRIHSATFKIMKKALNFLT